MHKAKLKAGQKRRPSREEDYESDDEFVENDGSDVEKGRSSKKQKKEPKEKRKSKGITNGSSWEVRFVIHSSFPGLSTGILSSRDDWN